MAFEGKSWGLLYLPMAPRIEAVRREPRKQRSCRAAADIVVFQVVPVVGLYVFAGG